MRAAFYLAVLPAALFIAASTDLIKREIPIWLFTSLSAFFLISLRKTLCEDNLAGFLVMGAAFLLLAITGKAGGGDILMFSAIGGFLGLSALPAYLILLSAVSLASSPFIIRKLKREGRLKDLKTLELPLAPYAAAAYGLLIAYVYFTGKMML